MIRRSLLACLAALAATPRAEAQGQTVARWVMATPYAANSRTLSIRAVIQDIEQATRGRLVLPLHNHAPDALMAEPKAIGETLTQEWVPRAGPEGVEMLGRYRAAVQ